MKRSVILRYAKGRIAYEPYFLPLQRGVPLPHFPTHIPLEHMKKLVTLIAVVAFAIPFLAPRAEAQFTFMAFGGYDLDVEELFIGVGAEFPLMPANGLPFALALRPSAEYFFMPSESDMGFEASMSLIQINAEAIADLADVIDGPIGLFAGAGLGMAFISSEFSGGGVSISDSSTELGLNLLGGVEFGIPFVQFRLTTAGSTRAQLMGGIRLAL